MTTWTVDVAGAVMGGALRWRTAAQAYVERSGRHDVAIIGQGQPISPGWLVARERFCRSHRVVAANNLGAVTGLERTVLLRNALDFLHPEEEHLVPTDPRRQVTTALVRRLARRATRIVVPSTAMAHRVIRHLPSVESRIEVRFHPVELATSAGQLRPGLIDQLGDLRIIFCPTLPGSHRVHSRWLGALIDAVTERDDLALVATFDRPPEVTAAPRLHFVGRVTPDEADALRSRAAALVYPAAIESFGYPLAEARAAGRPVLAFPGPLAGEIAGPALVECEFRSRGEIQLALDHSLAMHLDPDPVPFAPYAYFAGLFAA